MEKGRQVLSDAELIGILIGSGTRKLTAVQLSQQILSSVKNDLNALGVLTVQDLIKFPGIGEAKAITIIAALELGRRRKEQEPAKRTKMLSRRAGPAWSLSAADWALQSGPTGCNSRRT